MELVGVVASSVAVVFGVVTSMLICWFEIQSVTKIREIIVFENGSKRLISLDFFKSRKIYEIHKLASLAFFQTRKYLKTFFKHYGDDQDCCSTYVMVFFHHGYHCY